MSIPKRFNLGSAILDRWNETGAERVALIEADADGATRSFSFRQISLRANRLANVLVGHQLVRGDRVAIIMGQGHAAALAHLAVLKAGMIATPIRQSVSPERLLHALSLTQARAVITNTEGIAQIAPLRAELPNLVLVLSVDGTSAAVKDLESVIAMARDHFQPVITAADDPAILVPVTGPRGARLGALHSHGALLGQLSGIRAAHDGFPHPGDLAWTPTDWADDLMEILLPAWYLGVPVLACPAPPDDPEALFAVMARYGVRNAFLGDQSLAGLAGLSGPAMSGPAEGLALRSVSARQTMPVDPALLLAVGTHLGVPVALTYGQAESGTLCSQGRPLPDRAIAILDEAGKPQEPGQPGRIAVHQPDPGIFVGYWRDTEATAAKFVGSYMLTGDLGRIDSAGQFELTGRNPQY